MMLADIIFTIFFALTIIGALGAVFLKNVFYNALCLIVSLFGVAAIFIYLNSEFLAVMEIIIYVGGISIAIIFAIMLSRPMFQKYERRAPLKLGRAALLSALFGAGIWLTLKKTNWPLVSLEGDYSIRALGKSLLSVNILPFEVISVILLVAIIGALVISNKQDG